MKLIIFLIAVGSCFFIFCAVDFWFFDFKIMDFFEGKYKDYWCKHRSKKYILKKIKHIDKLSRDKCTYTSLVQELVIKSMGSAMNGESFPDVFNKTSTEYLNLTKNRENCVSMLKYILGVVEKYPLLEEVKVHILGELFAFIKRYTSGCCSFEEVDISFNGFKIISFYSKYSVGEMDVLDNKTGEKHRLHYNNYFDNTERWMMARTFLRTLSLTETTKVVEPSPTKVKVNYIRTSTGA